MVQDLGTYTFTRDSILRFAAKFDPQPFHLNDAAAEDSHFGALCASGWHTASVFMKLNVERGRKEFYRLTGYDGPPVEFGPSPGMRNIRWELPVYVGESIRYTNTLNSKRKLPNRPGWGLITNTSEAFKEDGSRVLTMDGAVMVRTD